MGEKITVPYHLVATKGTSGFKEIWTVTGGKRFHAKKIEIFFPTGASDELHVALYYGMRKVFPKIGDIVGDAIKYEKTIDVIYHSGDSVRIYYKNDNPTYDREADIILEGVLK